MYSCSLKSKLAYDNIEFEKATEIVNSNYKLLEPDSFIDISFIVWKNKYRRNEILSVDYSKPHITKNGNTQANDSIPKYLIDFCEKNELTNICLYSLKDKSKKVYSILEFRKNQTKKNETISYIITNNEEFNYFGLRKKILIGQNTYFVIFKSHSLNQ
ncbi:hypothetical protein GCM10011343_26240 [Flavobacterium orientale]|uniref:Uncharacterized protein n=1 Tax=Flavobacterium orientale TaxID=1756020 RepID=A0A916Y8C7_9FLAO|nr:hypothetical protein GCM10011343_26240 [Flavobacterium orientale]